VIDLILKHLTVDNSKNISKINSIFLIHRVQDLYSENVTNKLCARKTHGFNTSTAYTYMWSQKLWKVLSNNV